MQLILKYIKNWLNIMFKIRKQIFIAELIWKQRNTLF